MDLSDSDMDTENSSHTSTLSSSVSSEEGELEKLFEDEYEIENENEYVDMNNSVEDQLADLLAENRQLKKKIQLLEGNSDPNCLCTVIWHNISNFNTSKIVKQLEKAKIEANQSKSKSKEQSLPGYEQSKRPFTKKYFDNSKDNEYDDLFIVDKNTSSVTTEMEAPSYLSLSIDAPDDTTKEVSLTVARPAKSNPCFNCGLEGHPVRECPQPKNFQAINKNRQLYMAAAPSEKRYWEDKASKYNPGELSPALREALKISADAPPPWYNKMLKFGYPPGYTREIGYSKDDIVIVDHADEASQIGKGPSGSFLTPTVMFPGIDNKYLIQVSHALATGSVVESNPEIFPKSDIVSEIIEMKDSKKVEKKGNKTKEKKGGKKGDKEKRELGEGKNTNEKKKKNQPKDSEKKSAKNNNNNESKGEPKKKENSLLKKAREENDEMISVPQLPQWSDASEGRYEPTESTGVWKALHPILKKRKSEKQLSASKEDS
jgi:hypothetical protein